MRSVCIARSFRRFSWRDHSAPERAGKRASSTTGEYLADYHRGSEGAIQKHKVRYLSVLVPAGDRDEVPKGFLPEIVASQADLRASDDGRPLLVDLSEDLAIRQLRSPYVGSQSHIVAVAHRRGGGLDQRRQ